MAACAPSFSSCDVVPQQCYRRTAEESPAVSAPLSTYAQPSQLISLKKKKENIAASSPGNYQVYWIVTLKVIFATRRIQLHSVVRRSTGHPVHLTCFQRQVSL